ncbi:orotate phosphoribosyltransferase [bacterium]|nr:orotate phosphoribosyltransferase [bacterium]
MEREALAARIYQVAHLTGHFVLRSGKTSSEYFDKYRFESDPEILAEIAAQMAELLPEETEMLAGLETGGIPLATALSLYTGLPAIFVRKKAKDYGTRRLAEGADFAGRNVAVVEDVITTGGQVVESTRKLEELGAEIAAVVCVIDRQSGGRENIEKAGYRLASLFTKSDLEAAAKATHRNE